MRIRKVMPLLFFVFFGCNIANATDYYISTSGNNSNNGTSQTTPWQTLSKLQTVCNNGTIKAGDNIYFKKGDSFSGQLLMTNLWGYQGQFGNSNATHYFHKLWYRCKTFIPVHSKLFYVYPRQDYHAIHRRKLHHC
jgi:hypothetical protein